MPVETYSAAMRRLGIHEGHAMRPNMIDARFLDEFLRLANQMALTGTAQQVSAKVASWAELEVTELGYQPVGPDIARELRAFAGAARVFGLGATLHGDRGRLPHKSAQHY